MGAIASTMWKLSEKVKGAKKGRRFLGVGDSDLFFKFREGIALSSVRNKFVLDFRYVALILHASDSK